MRRRFEYLTKQTILDLEARGKDAFERGHPYISTNSMHWRRGWKNAQAAKQKRTVVVPPEDPEHRAMLQRAESMKRGGGGRWTVLGR
jgi:hypothetical protein